MIPDTYEKWRHCITVDCGIPLTKDYIVQRLEVFNKPSSFEVEKFMRLYGEEHTKSVIGWFERALKEL